MNDFNPNDASVANGNFFALPVKLEDAEIVILPVEWDATVSYNDGTAFGPSAILEASLQVDLFDANIPNAWEIQLSSKEFPEELRNLNETTRALSKEIISKIENGLEPDTQLLLKVNQASDVINDYVYSESSRVLEQGKMPVVLGGEHSVPFGLIKALGEKHGEFGILHIDAHADLRCAFEGFKYSHASIMFNVMDQIPSVSQLTQVGIRDYCQDESDLIVSNPRITAFTDFEIKKAMFEGSNWALSCEQIIKTLPHKVYMSFDIDGLSAEFCPSTGTPVPGGLDFNQADYLLYKLMLSGKEIIGFDLNEVCPSPDSEWDANVGARILYKLCLYSKIKKK